MINPHSPTDFNRPLIALQEFLLFTICVVGKNAEQQAVKLDAILRDLEAAFVAAERPRHDHFARIRDYPLRVLLLMRQHKLGKYTLLAQAFDYASRSWGLKLAEVSCEALIKCPGISLKTAKFFLLHSRANSTCIPIDTYVLQFLRRRFPKAPLPKSSPQDPAHYAWVEALFLAECWRLGVPPYKADITCWRSKGMTINPKELENFERPIAEAFKSAAQ